MHTCGGSGNESGLIWMRHAVTDMRSFQVLQQRKQNIAKQNGRGSMMMMLGLDEQHNELSAYI